MKWLSIEIQSSDRYARQIHVPGIYVLKLILHVCHHEIIVSINP